MWRAIVVSVLLAACGDNATVCGTGTVDHGGTCVADGTGTCGPGTKLDSDGMTCIPDGTIVCSDGTQLDPATGHCAIDPNACRDGTVLVGGACVDPADGLTIDLEEQAEPNGLSLFGEPSVNSAGPIQVPALGAAPFVIHGTTEPADHDGDGALDPDADTYTLHVDAPTVLAISVDGLHGMAGAFVARSMASDAKAFGDFTREADALAGDTARKQLFLPMAGTYAIAIVDTRSALLGIAAGAATGARPFEYYVSIETVALPAPTPLVVQGNLAYTPPNTALANGALAVYSAVVDDGLDEALLGFTRDSVTPALMVMVDPTTLRARADDPSATAADATFGGGTVGQAMLFVVDAVADRAIDPAPYSLLVQKSSGVAMSATGMQVTAPKHSTSPSGPAQFDNFYFDVATAGDTLGMALAFDVPVDVAIIDQGGAVVAPLTWLSDQPEGHTTTSYTGNLRFAHAGRYYVSAYDPASATGTLGLTSTFAVLAPQTATEPATLLGTLPVPYGAAPITYTSMRASVGWQQFGMSAPSGSFALFDPAAAYGRLDPITVDGVVRAPDPHALATGVSGTLLDRILLDDPVDTYYVHVRGTPGGSLSFTAGARFGATDFGAQTPGDPIAPADVRLDDTPRYFLVRTTPGARVAFAATPANLTSPDLQHLAVSTLAADETILSTTAATAGGQPVQVAQLAPPSGWIAWSVAEQNGAQVALSDIVAQVTTHPAQTYAISAGATAFANACSGGTAVALSNTNDGFSTASIPAPAGFRLFDRPIASFVVAANGYLTPVAAGTSANGPLGTQDGLHGTIAPYWDDLYGIGVCTQVIGTKRVIQWLGDLCGPRAASGGCNGTTPVEFQVILDGATSTIEFVYGPQQAAAASGGSATIGIEDPQSTTAVTLGFDQSATVAPNTSKLLTPGT